MAMGRWLSFLSPSVLLLLLPLCLPGATAVSYVERVVTLRLRENLIQLMAQPFQPLEYTTES